MRRVKATIRPDQPARRYLYADMNQRGLLRYGVRKARAEVAAYADCTGSQMMAMFGWSDPKMPRSRHRAGEPEKLGVRGMEKIVAFDQSQSLDDVVPQPEANNVATPRGNGVVTFPGNIRKKSVMISMLNVGLWCARRECQNSAKLIIYVHPPRNEHL